MQQQLEARGKPQQYAKQLPQTSKKMARDNCLRILGVQVAHIFEAAIADQNPDVEILSVDPELLRVAEEPWRGGRRMASVIISPESPT